jgi:uncharacterized Tic20 family protein
VPAAAAEDELKPANQDEKTVAILGHTLPAVGVLLMVPLASVILSLAFWIWKREGSAYIAAHAKEAFHFSVCYSVGGYLLAYVLSMTCVLAPLAVAIPVIIAAFSIYGAFETSKGEFYRYPYTWRFLK